MTRTASGWKRTSVKSPAFFPVPGIIQSGASPPAGRHIGRPHKRFSLLPDTHAHLDGPEFGDDLDAILARARGAGVDRILAVGSNLASSRAAVELARRHEMVYAAVGVHPHQVARFKEEEGAVEDLLCDDNVVAVGEIGLDYHREGATREEQLAAFRRQLHWAREANLPVSVHNRDADEDTLLALEEAGVRAVLHCFSSTRETAARAVEAGHLISFAGNVTFPRADALRQVARTVPLDHLLLETDSPVLAPQAHRGRRNEPAHVTETACMLAGMRGEPLEILAATISENADRVFHWRST